MAEHAAAFGASRDTLHCTRFAPYYNSDNAQPSYIHFDVLEFAFLAALCLQLVLAWRTRRLQVLGGVLLLGVMMEAIGFITQSHTHVEFRLQLACFLSLKEVAWYALTVFSAMTAAWEFTSLRGVDFALLTAVLAILQDAPYEMTNALQGVQAVYINGEDFAFGDLARDKINQGSSMVILSFFMVALAAAWIVQRHALPILALPLGTPLVLVVLLAPINLAKIAGCAGEESLFSLHGLSQCLALHTPVANTAVVLVGGVLAVLRVMWALLNDDEQPQAPLKKLFTLRLLLASAALCHGTFAYHASLATDTDNNALSHAAGLFSLAAAHSGLLCILALRSNNNKRKQS